MPASNSRALEKAQSLNCDAVIFDLEDALADSARESAHENLSALIPTLDLGAREKIVRLPEMSAPSFQMDLEAALSSSPDALLLPKVEAGSDLANLGEQSQHKLPLWAMIETPTALVNLNEICSSGVEHGLECLIVGPNDLAKTTGAKMQAGRQVMLPWLMQILAVARAHDLCVLDGVYNNFRNGDGLAVECDQGASMGYDGKTLIHPNQIEAANASFGITEDELVRARKIVDLFSCAEAVDQAVMQLDGEMVEHLHLNMAKQLIAAHEETQS